MAKLKTIPICALVVILFIAMVPLDADGEEKSVFVEVGPVLGLNWGQWGLNQICQDELDRQCRRLSPIDFDCDDGFAAGPWLDFDSVRFRSENYNKPFPGDPYYEMDVYCYGNCIADCEEPLPEPDPIDCFSTNRVYCNNICPGLFLDSNGVTAGRCERVPDGSGNGTTCWGCRNTVTGEFWKHPRGGGGFPEEGRDVRIRRRIDDFDDDFDSGGSWGGSGSGCAYYINQFVGYEEIVVNGEIILSPVYDVTCIEN